MKPRFSEKRNDVILVQDRISGTSKHSLRPGLRCRRITPYSIGVRPFPARSVFINFGATEVPIPVPKDSVVLNTPDAIRQSSNKLSTFKLLKAADIPTVRWTVDSEEGKTWLQKGHNVLARKSLSSSGGRGIHVIKAVGAAGGRELVLLEAPLYTRYFPKTHEFRVHVVDGVAIDLTEKKLREEKKDDRAKVSIVRSHHNGWVHAHDGITLVDNADLESLRNLGVSAVKAVGLDFGCADILAVVSESTAELSPRRLKTAVVCEVNAAPGIENTATRQAYVRALNTLIDKRQKGA